MEILHIAVTLQAQVFNWSGPGTLIHFYHEIKENILFTIHVL